MSGVYRAGGNVEPDGGVAVFGKDESVVAAAAALGGEGWVRFLYCVRGEGEVGMGSYWDESTPGGMGLEGEEGGGFGHEVFEGGAGAEFIPREELAVVPESGPLFAFFFDGATNM